MSEREVRLNSSQDLYSIFIPTRRKPRLHAQDARASDPFSPDVLSPYPSFSSTSRTAASRSPLFRSVHHPFCTATSSTQNFSPSSSPAIHIRCLFPLSPLLVTSLLLVIPRGFRSSNPKHDSSTAHNQPQPLTHTYPRSSLDHQNLTTFPFLHDQVENQLAL